MADIALDDVKRLQVNDGDVLVLSVPSQAPAHVLEHIAETMREAFPTVPCVMLASPDFDIGVASLGDMERFRKELDAAFDRVAEGRMAARVSEAVTAALTSYGRVDPAAAGAAQEAARRAFLDE